MIRYLFTLLLLTLPLSLIAAETTKEKQRWYQVELILFKQPQSAITSSEHWDGWSNKKVPVNYDESIELHYPQDSSLLENNSDSLPVENAPEIISLREAEAIVAESLQPEAEKPHSTTLQPFTFSEVSKWELGEIYERLNSSNQYELLIHTAWIQPGLNKDVAVPVHIHDYMALVEEERTTLGNVLPSAEIANGETPSESGAVLATSYPLESTLFEQSYQNETIQKDFDTNSKVSEITFNGTVKVVLARYLHFNINLDYAPLGFPQEIGASTNEWVDGDSQAYTISENPVATMTPGNNRKNGELFYDSSNLNSVLDEDENIQQSVYRIQESRRMRSKELHYIDHPKVGVLIKIMPVELPKVDSDNSANKS